MKEIQIENKEKFIRSLGRRMDQTSLPARLGLTGKKSFAGCATDRKVILYRKKSGILSLFALTLRGKWDRREGKDVLLCRFGRSLPLTFLWVFWCLLELAAGLSLVTTEPFFALCFLGPACLFSLPLFFRSKKEKERLLSLLRELNHFRSE